MLFATIKLLCSVVILSTLASFLSARLYYDGKRIIEKNYCSDLKKYIFSKLIKNIIDDFIDLFK